MEKTIKYTSPNGYTGILYGESSFSIRDCNNHEVMHTGFRNINTYDELVKLVEDFPRFRKMLSALADDDEDEVDV